MKQFYAPNGLKIIGTADTVKAVANISGWEENGEPIYAGGSDVDWDSQTNRTTFVNGEETAIVVDEDGEEWPKAECVLREDDTPEWDEDENLTADALQAKHSPNGDGEHPVYTRSTWREAVALEHTALGYWVWIEQQFEDAAAHSGEEG